MRTVKRESIANLELQFLRIHSDRLRIGIHRANGCLERVHRHQIGEPIGQQAREIDRLFYLGDDHTARDTAADDSMAVAREFQRLHLVRELAVEPLRGAAGMRWQGLNCVVKHCAEAIGRGKTRRVRSRLDIATRVEMPSG